MAAAAAVLVMLRVAPVSLRDEGGRSEEPGFIARGSGEHPERWIALQLYRAKPTGYERVDGAIHPDDSLAFAYVNRPASRYRYLMILGFDDRRSVFWFFPGPASADDNPRSVAIERADDLKELGEEVRHPLAPGPLHILAIFSEGPLEVRAVEAALQERLANTKPAAVDRLSIPDTGQLSFVLDVR